MHRAIPQEQRIRDEWNALVHEMERPEVFYTCEWAMAVEQAYRASMKPLLLLAHEGETLVAWWRWPPTTRKSKFLSCAGTPLTIAISSVLRRDGRSSWRRFSRELSKLHMPILRLANLPADSATSRIMKDAAGQHGYQVFSRPAYQCAQIALGSAAERQELKQSVVKRKAFRSNIKGLEKTAPVTMDHLTQWNAIQPNLPRFVEAQVARFLAGGRASNLASAERQNFLAALAELLSSAGWLVLTRLLVGDEPVAWNYGFQFAGSWFYYQPTFDARWRQFSPGFLPADQDGRAGCADPGNTFVGSGTGGRGLQESLCHRLSPDPARYNYEFTGAASPRNCALSRGDRGQSLAAAGAMGATAGGPAFRGKCKSMRVLLLHPEDELPAQRRDGKWDLVVDLGRAPLATYERWGAQTGGRVISLYDFGQDFEDLHRVRELLQLGMGQWVDGLGIDWWDVLSLMIEPDLRQLMLIGRLAHELPRLAASSMPAAPGPGDRAPDIYRRETSQAGERISSRHAMGAALSRCFRPAGRAQMSQAFQDKFDREHFVRRRLARRRRSSKDPVVLLPSAYVNVFAHRGFVRGAASERKISAGLCQKQRSC